jgi:hypothetical protein
VTTFIKAFVDSKSKNNDAAFGQDVFATSDGGLHRDRDRRGVPGQRVGQQAVLDQHDPVAGAAWLRLTSDGGYVAAGVTGDFADADNFWLVKTDSNGNVASGSYKDQHAGTTTEQPAG